MKNKVGFLVLGDFLAFWVSFFMVISLRFNNTLLSQVISSHLKPFAILYIFWILIFFLFGLYDVILIKPIIPNIRRFILSIISCFVLSIFFFYTFYTFPIFKITPKTNLLLQVLGFGIFSFFIRKYFYNLFSEKIFQQVILIGKTPYLKNLSEIIKNNPHLGLKFISFTNNIAESLKNYSNYKNSIFILESKDTEIFKKDIASLYKNQNEIIDVTEAYEKYLHKIPIGYISKSWIIEHIKPKNDLFYSLTKKLFDIILSLFFIIILSSIFIIIAILIKFTSKGPILIRQKRVGENGEIFILNKFRSMLALSEGGQAEKDGAVWTQNNKNDPRITKIGRFLRNTHLDETPQLFNILKGDLSFVGPRPERPEFTQILSKEIPYYNLRHIVKAGLTGWAQVNYKYGSSVEDAKEKLEYDFYYIKNQNIFFDILIILKTVAKIFYYKST